MVLLGEKGDADFDEGRFVSSDKLTFYYNLTLERGDAYFFKSENFSITEFWRLFFRDGLDISFAGYPAILKTGFWISGGCRIPDISVE